MPEHEQVLLYAISAKLSLSLVEQYDAAVEFDNHKMHAIICNRTFYSIHFSILHYDRTHAKIQAKQSKLIIVTVSLVFQRSCLNLVRPSPL